MDYPRRLSRKLSNLHTSFPLPRGGSAKLCSLISQCVERGRKVSIFCPRVCAVKLSLIIFAEPFKIRDPPPPQINPSPKVFSNVLPRSGIPRELSVHGSAVSFSIPISSTILQPSYPIGPNNKSQGIRCRCKM